MRVDWVAQLKDLEVPYSDDAHLLLMFLTILFLVLYSWFHFLVFHQDNLSPITRTMMISIRFYNAHINYKPHHHRNPIHSQPNSATYSRPKDNSIFFPFRFEWLPSVSTSILLSFNGKNIENPFLSSLVLGCKPSTIVHDRGLEENVTHPLFLFKYFFFHFHFPLHSIVFLVRHFFSLLFQIKLLRVFRTFIFLWFLWVVVSFGLFPLPHIMQSFSCVFSRLFLLK